jgi:hypothetical protein
MYIEQLTNFEVKIQDGLYFVCLLDKAFYELKQNTRLWYKRIRQRLEELDYIIFPNNNLIFYHQLKKLIITFYIDNIHYMRELLNEIKKYLISGIQKCILELILIIINYSESAILINLTISRELLISITITISKLEKYQ